MKILSIVSNKSRVGLVALSLVAGGIVMAPAQAAAPVPGTTILRLVSPVLNTTPTSAANALDQTFDAAANKWDTYYGKGLKFYIFYRNVGTTTDFTWRATNAAGTPLASTTVYMIVNKSFSCSDTKFTTTGNPVYGNPDDLNGQNNDRGGNPKAIPRDWCGDDAGGHPQWGRGESSIPGTTDSNGLVTFSLTNTNMNSEAEPAPVSLTTLNPYDPWASNNPFPCSNDDGCLATTITASLVLHPQLADDRTEDKDLLNIHYVNNAVTNDIASVTMAPSSGEKTLGFTVTDLVGDPKSGVKLKFSNVTGYGTLSADSAYTDSNGHATVGVSSECAEDALPVCAGISKVKATIDGTFSSGQTTVMWSAVAPSPTPTASKPKLNKAASITGTAKVGQKLTASKGSWSGATSWSYKWYACSATGTAKTAVPAGCVAISGATASTYKLATKQKGKFIRVFVTGTNTSGKTYSASATKGKVS